MDSKYEPTVSWLKRRKLTTVLFGIQSFILGMDYSLFLLTAWVYIESLVPASNPKEIYTVTIAGYIFSNIIAVFIVSKVMDTSRQIKKCFVILNVLCVIGNIMYTIPFSPWFLIVGKFIGGAGLPLKAVISSELGRVYDYDEASAKFSLMGMLYSTGLAIGPAINLIFTNVEFQVNDWIVTEANIPGLYMALFFGILSICFWFYASDLSKEFDLRAMQKEKLFKSRKIKPKDIETTFDEKTKLTTSLIVPSTKEIGFWESIRYLLRIDIMIILSSVLLLMFFLTVFDIILPLVVVSTLKRSLVDIEIFFFCTSIILIFIFLLILWRKFSIGTLYFIYVTAVVSMIIVTIGILVLQSYPKNNEVVMISSLIICVTFSIIFVPIESYLVTILSRMVPSQILTFADGCRINATRIGCIIAVFSTTHIYSNFKQFAISFCTLVFLSLIAILLRFRTLRNPKLK